MRIAQELREIARKSRRDIFNDPNSIIYRQYRKILSEAKKEAEKGWYKIIITMDRGLSHGEVEMIQQELRKEGFESECMNFYDLNVSWE